MPDVRHINHYLTQMRLHWPHETWWYDLDGTVTGSAGHKVTPWNELLPPDHCTVDTSISSGWNVGVNGSVCDETVDWIRWSFNLPQPPSLEVRPVPYRSLGLGAFTLPRWPFTTHISSESWRRIFLSLRNIPMDVEYSKSLKLCSIFSIPAIFASWC